MAKRRTRVRARGTPRAVPAHRTYTPELTEHVRYRYEETAEPVITIAADLGIHPSSVHRMAKRLGWVRRNLLPPRDLSPALRLFEEARALAEGASATANVEVVGEIEPRVSLPPRSGGEGRPPKAVGVGGLAAEKEPPTPDPSPPFPRVKPGVTGGGETAPPAHGQGNEMAPEPSAIERLERALTAEVATIEALRARRGPVPLRPREAERTARTLGLLVNTLEHLVRLRAAAGLPPAISGSNIHDDDDIPADIDEFRRRLARRIDEFVKSRTDAGRADRDATAAVVDGAR